MSRILIVDDCEEIREVLGEILADAGYEVSLAENVEEAQRLCNSTCVDLIICDLVLPLDETVDEDMEEIEVHSAMVGVQAISEFSRSHPKVPVIAISGELTGPALQHMKQFGAVNAISKPFKRDELLLKVSCALTPAVIQN